MSESLAPCPFCGGKAVKTIMRNPAALVIRCNNDDCRIYVLRMMKERAVADWNRRFTSERERLTEKVVQAAVMARINKTYNAHRDRCIGELDLDRALANLAAHDDVQRKGK